MKTVKSIGPSTRASRGKTIFTRISQMSVTNPRDVLQINNVDAHCDKLATELSWQRFASKVANFQLPHLHLTYPTCIWRLRWGWPGWVLPRFSATGK